MKSLIILGDGMADEPIEELGWKTPLQYAYTPYMNFFAMEGMTGILQTVPDGFPPGSEVANLSILGYDLSQVYEGRGVLEAASMGVDLKPNELALRCNLICIENGLIKNHSAGHISKEEAKELIDFLNQKLGSEKVKFYAGTSYRNLLVIKGGSKYLKCIPPHDVPLQLFRPLMAKANISFAKDTADLINELTFRSQKLLPNHKINYHRKYCKKDQANSIWLWSPGYRPAMQTMQVMYNIKKGSVISAVNLIYGIGIYAGLENIFVEGATGIYNTNYKGKAQAAIEALKTNDFVYLHVEASDEASHEGNVKLKVKTIENLDRYIVRPIYEFVKKISEPIAIGILSDHPTPCSIRTHTNQPVPFLIYKSGNQSQLDDVKEFNEFSVKKGKFKLLKGNQFIKNLIADEIL